MTLCKDIQALYERHIEEIDIQNICIQFSNQKLGIKKCMCNKIINENDACFTCYTCSDDQSVTFCPECFYAVDHKGHNWECKSGTIGQCDCGSVISLRKESICKDHLPVQQQLFSSLSIQDVTKLLINGYHILLINKEQGVVSEQLKDSEVMIRIVSILSLLTDDNVPLNKFIDLLISDQYFQYFYSKPVIDQDAKYSFFDEFLLEFYNQKNKTEQLFSKILNGDLFFRIYSLRITSRRNQQIVNNQNNSIVEMLIQSIIEQLGMYLTNQWHFLENINQATFKCLQTLAKQTDNFQKDIPEINYLDNLQHFMFCNHYTTTHSILYSINENKQQTFAIISQEKQIFLNQICEKNIYSLNIENSHNFLLQMQLYFYLIQHDCQYCQQYANHINIRYIPQNNHQLLQLLQQANINVMNADKNIFIDENNLNNHQFEYKQHYMNIKNLLINLLSHEKYRQLLLQVQNNTFTEENTSTLQIIPIYVPQLYLCKFMELFKQEDAILKLLSDLNRELQLEKEMSLQDFVKLSLFEIIQHRKVFLQIKLQELSTKKYVYDLEVIAKISNEQFQYLLCDYYYIISKFLPLLTVDEQISFITSIFNVSQKSLIEFLGELFYIPISCNQKERLKHFITNIYKDYSFDKLRKTELMSYFPYDLISQCFTELYSTQTIHPLVQGSLSQKDTHYIEIAMLQNSNEYLLNNKLPKRTLDEDIFNQNFKLLLTSPQLIQFLKEQLLDYANNSETMNVQLARILKQANFNFKELPIFEKLDANKHIKEIIQIQQPKSVEFNEKIITNVVNKLSIKDKLGQKLKQRSLSASQASSLLQFDVQGLTDKDFEETCPICHQNFNVGAIYAIPAKITYFYNFDNRLSTQNTQIPIFRTCMHSYHQHCMKSEKCMMCQFGKDIQLYYIQDINKDIYDLDYKLTESEQKQINQIKYPKGSGNQYITLKTLNQIFQYYENLYYIDGVDIYSDLFINDMKSLTCVYKCFVQIGRSEQQANNYEKYAGFIKGRALYNILKDFVISNDQNTKILIQKCKAAASVNNIQRISLFSKGVIGLQNSYDMIKHLLNNQITCTCGKQVYLSSQKQKMAICVNCSAPVHLNCVPVQQGRLICGVCESQYGFYLPYDGSVVQSACRLYPQPYRTRFAEQQCSLLGQEVFINQVDKEYLITLLALQAPYKIYNVKLLRELVMQIGWTIIQQNEMQHLLNEDKINEEDMLLFISDENDDQEVSQ